MIRGRIIFDDARSGGWNMAVDQALLGEVDRGEAPALRFYRWSAPTLSLGYFQRLDQRNQHPASREAPLVRRATGGGAILHDAELTYSLCMPIRDRASSAVRAIYDDVHGSIIAAMHDFGVRLVRFADSGFRSSVGGDEEPFLCFQRRTAEDLVLRGYKIVGSAQRRSARAVLQHGSILLAASRCAPELPGVHNLCSVEIAEEDLARRIAHHLGLVLGIEWTPAGDDELSPAEVRRILENRFAAPEWTGKR